MKGKVNEALELIIGGGSVLVQDMGEHRICNVLWVVLLLYLMSVFCEGMESFLDYFWPIHTALGQIQATWLLHDL